MKILHTSAPSIAAKAFILPVLAILFSYSICQAAEKSFRINFACVEPTEQNIGNVIDVKVNQNNPTYLSAGSEYVAKFNSLTNIKTEKGGTGWIVGDPNNVNSTSTYAGIINMAFSEKGQVNATRIEVRITARAAGPTPCVLKLKNDHNLSKSASASLKQVGTSHTFSFDLDGNTTLKSLILQNYESTGNVPFNLTSLEVFYTPSDPETISTDGSFADADSGADFSFNGSHLHFDHTVSIADGAALFEADNHLTISAPEGYFLAQVLFNGASADSQIYASSGAVSQGKWLPAEGDIAQNNVVFTTSTQVKLTGLKISYLPFRINHSLTTSTVIFTPTETTANSLNIHSSFTNSNRSTVDRFIIRANGIQIAETQPKETEATFNSLPYLTDGRLTISPVINGTERQPEALDGAAMPNLAASSYSIEANTLICTPSDDNTTATIGALMRLDLPEAIPADIVHNFEISVTDHPEAVITIGESHIDIYIPVYLENIPYIDYRPDFSGAEFQPFTISFTPIYKFIVAEEYRTLITTPADNRLKAATLDSDGIQTVSFETIQLQATFASDSSISHVQPIPADTPDTATRYYPLQGIEIPPAALPPGLSIRRTATRTTLHLHR